VTRGRARAAQRSAEQCEQILKRKGVEFRGKCVAKAVDLAAKSVELASGEKVAFDLLVSHALHRAPQLLADCKLANETGFVPANVHTLRTAVPGVYAIGDCAALKARGARTPERGAAVR
jgi:NADPH-dependent 2,4-dienoyl-CoA reductase/sulfur reductase-like enzyme